MILKLHARNTANIISVATNSTFSKEANFITVLRFLTPERPYLIPRESHRAQKKRRDLHHMLYDRAGESGPKGQIKSQIRTETPQLPAPLLITASRCDTDEPAATPPSTKSQSRSEVSGGFHVSTNNDGQRNCRLDGSRHGPGQVSADVFKKSTAAGRSAEAIDGLVLSALQRCPRR